MVVVVEEADIVALLEVVVSTAWTGLRTCSAAFLRGRPGLFCRVDGGAGGLAAAEPEPGEPWCPAAVGTDVALALPPALVVVCVWGSPMEAVKALMALSAVTGLDCVVEEAVVIVTCTPLLAASTTAR